MRLLLACAALGIALAPLAPASEADQNLVEVAVGAGSFNTLAKAVETAGLLETLRDQGPFTVFAPTDEAFAKLPEGTLETLLDPANKPRLVEILTLHVVSGKIDAATALAARSAESLSGLPLNVSLDGGRLKVNGVKVIQNDIRATNGVIHVIDSVLLPPTAPTPRDGALNILALAIDRGVPLYNNGQAAACTAVYEVAVRSLTERPEGVDEKIVKELRRALASVEQVADPVENAWTLRRAMDRAILQLREEPRSSAASVPVSGEELKSLFECDASHDPFFSVNDDVMGGISRSAYAVTARGTALFKGALSLENNGGFATVRSRARDLEIGDYDGLVMRVRGDGRTYGFSALPSSSRWEVNIWRTDFTPPAGEWVEIRVPFKTLVRSVMGRRRPDSGPLPPSRIRSIAFSISDKNETPFQLEIDWIKAYRDSEGPTELTGRNVQF